MTYGVEWMGGGVYGIVLLFLIVPEFAAIAVVAAQRRTRWIHSPSGIPEPIARRIACGSWGERT